MAVLESFEGTPLTGDVTWTKTFQDGTTSVCTVTSTTSHVTEGAKTWRIQGNSGLLDYAGLSTSAGIDLSTYTSVSIDVYIATINAGSYITLFISDAGAANSYYTGATTTGATGAFTITTLVADIVTNLGSATGVYFSIYADGVPAAVDYYIDNLVSSGGGSTYTMTAATAAFTLTANATALKHDQRMTASAAAFTLTAVDVVLDKTRLMHPDVAVFTLTFPSAGATHGSRIGVEVAAFSITMNSAGFGRPSQIFADTTEYSLFFPPPHLITTGTVWEARSRRVDRHDVVF